MQTKGGQEEDDDQEDDNREGQEIGSSHVERARY
eukprot:CAMPEP_0195036124 /NCGR_PEP_ID=MMETSP0326_2-20130528/71771_1 /TAXON_ID=2866 ORGANISM="Crypthecodinium cohnii, Strain Seligo" /NCGR_SAMPLE_ID=MMETSP0326_2 /ASSEMBLY_ACC=CAM_ASM_000348 /LENGTH=33 /DNA_ID= /DNA_START= /DNA_END= /DNA_ORIENTATION=